VSSPTTLRQMSPLRISCLIAHLPPKMRRARSRASLSTKSLSLVPTVRRQHQLGQDSLLRKKRLARGTLALKRVGTPTLLLPICVSPFLVKLFLWNVAGRWPILWWIVFVVACVASNALDTVKTWYLGRGAGSATGSIYSRHMQDIGLANISFDRLPKSRRLCQRQTSLPLSALTFVVQLPRDVVAHRLGLYCGFHRKLGLLHLWITSRFQDHTRVADRIHLTKHVQVCGPLQGGHCCLRLRTGSSTSRRRLGSLPVSLKMSKLVCFLPGFRLQY
jgi:hypothetical protein